MTETRRCSVCGLSQAAAPRTKRFLLDHEDLCSGCASTAQVRRHFATRLGDLRDRLFGVLGEMRRTRARARLARQTLRKMDECIGALRSEGR